MKYTIKDIMIVTLVIAIVLWAVLETPIGKMVYKQMAQIWIPNRVVIQ